MGCRDKTELSVWQICFLITLSIICVIIAVAGWFRTIDPPDYGKLSNKWNRFNNVTSHVDINQDLLSFLDDIGSPPKLNNPHLYIQWTFLQMNDVYELIPLGGGKKGGLARVATIRKLLLQENPNTITFLAGDVVSPSALGMNNNRKHLIALVLRTCCIDIQLVMKTRCKLKHACRCDNDRCFAYNLISPRLYDE
jgi:hypothetical protein